MIGIEADNRLRMAQGVRLFWDEVRQQHLLLFPEGLLVLNATAFAVLELCDGRRSVSEIVTILTAQYSSDIEKDVYHLLSRITQRGLLKNSNE